LRNQLLSLRQVLPTVAYDHATIPQNKENNLPGTMLSVPPLEMDILPILIFHIGPHKTGTSAIQCYLTHFANQLYLEDSFAFLGRGYKECRSKKNVYNDGDPLLHIHAISDCLDNHAKKPCDETEPWKNFESLLDYHHSNRTNIIISDEAFSRTRFTSESFTLLHSLLTKKYNTRIVITYRRFSEWVPSWFNRKNKFYGEEELATKSWPDLPQRFLTTYIRSILKSGIKFNNLLQADEYTIQPTWAKRYHEPALISLMHPAEWLKRMYGLLFSDIVVFNTHVPNEDNGLIERFLLRVVPHSQKISDVTLSAMQKWEPVRANERVNLDYDILADMAHKKHIQNHQITRDEVIVAIKKRDEQDNKKNFKKCLTQNEQKYFIHMSLSFEQKLFADEPQSIYEDYMAESIAVAKICDIDTKKILADEEWKEFFKAL